MDRLGSPKDWFTNGLQRIIDDDLPNPKLAKGREATIDRTTIDGFPLSHAREVAESIVTCKFKHFDIYSFCFIKSLSHLLGASLKLCTQSERNCSTTRRKRLSKSNHFTRWVGELLNYPDELMVCIWTDEKFLVIAKLLNEHFFNRFIL